MTSTALTIEQYAEFVAPAERLWSIIGDPRRLPDWTHAGSIRVAGADDGGPHDLPAAWSPELSVVIAERETATWRVISLGQRVVEVSASTSCGDVGIGARVIAAQATQGSRLVFVARLEPAGSVIRARLRDVPALRRRFDRWTAALRGLAEQ